MNATNRALNRTGILVVGLVLLLAGAGAAAVAAVPRWLQGWQDGADALAVPFDPAQTATLAIVLAACVLVIVLLAVFVLRQGRGHTRTLVRRGGSSGEVVVDVRVAAALIEAALEQHPSVVSVSVSGYRVRHTPALKVALSVRRGSSPTDLREAVDGVVARWDALLGAEVPVLVTIG